MSPDGGRRNSPTGRTWGAPGLDVCIFARFEVNCEVMPLRSFANFKLVMSRHRKELRGTPKARAPRPVVPNRWATGGF